MISIKDYYISYYTMDNDYRHIIITSKIKNNPTLCGKTFWPVEPKTLMFTLEKYILNNIEKLRYIPICKKCIAKLPKKLRKQVIYNLVLTKLKS